MKGGKITPAPPPTPIRSKKKKKKNTIKMLRRFNWD